MTDDGTRLKGTIEEDRDAFGHALLDHLEGKPAHELIERDDGFIAVSAGTATYFSDPSDRQRTVAERAVGRVLDVGCGAGRYALYLQGLGIEVVGIDVSPLAVEVCRRRGLRDARALAVDEVDPSLGQFDSVVMLGNNLALFGSERGAKQILNRLRAVVPPGGRLVGENLDPYQTSDPDHLRYHERNRKNGRMGGQVRMRVRYRKYCSPWFDYLFLSLQELKALLDGTGWKLLDVFAVDGPSYAVHLERAPD